MGALKLECIVHFFNYAVPLCWVIQVCLAICKPITSSTFTGKSTNMGDQPAAKSKLKFIDTTDIHQHYTSKGVGECLVVKKNKQ